jgi:hypothetical protein
MFSFFLCAISCCICIYSNTRHTIAAINVCWQMKEFQREARLRTKESTGHRWLTSVILVTWEAEIGRTVVWGQPRQTVRCEWDLISKHRCKVDRRRGSRSKAPALQVRSPECKLQSHKQNKTQQKTVHPPKNQASESTAWVFPSVRWLATNSHLSRSSGG